MNNSDETLKQQAQNDAVLQAIAELSRKIDDYKKDSDNQFEAIRQGIVLNGVSYDRLKAEVLMLRADVKELTEEVRHNKRVLV
jgi:hypothetical protein